MRSNAYYRAVAITQTCDLTLQKKRINGGAERDVTTAINTIMVYISVFSILSRTPTLAIRISITPRAFIAAPMARDSCVLNLLNRPPKKAPANLPAIAIQSTITALKSTTGSVRLVRSIRKPAVAKKSGASTDRIVGRRICLKLGSDPMSSPHAKAPKTASSPWLA